MKVKWVIPPWRHTRRKKEELQEKIDTLAKKGIEESGWEGSYISGFRFSEEYEAR